MNYIVKNGIIVNEGSLKKDDLYIVDGKIADQIPAGTVEVVDATGCYVLPGVIDTHVHFREPGLTDKADMASESRAAISGGVTSVIDMPNTIPQTTTIETLESKERIAAEHCVANYGFMLGVTEDNIQSLLQIDCKRYAALKLFLGSSTGNMLVQDSDKLDELFEHARKLIVVHCEDEGVITANMAACKAQFEGTSDESASLHPKIRTTEACYVSTYKAIERARKYGTRLHIAHLSSAAELDLLSNKDINQKLITAEVTPNHLWFDDRDYATLGNQIKCNPSIKSNDDRLALWAALYDGLIDTIATDHAPHTWESKQRPYFAAPSGIPSIQHSLLMMLEPFFNPSVDGGQQSDLLQTWLPLIVTKMSHNPADIFGIRNRGYLRNGYWADVVLVRQGVTNVTDASLQYKCGWSPLLGQSFHGEIVRVFVNGVPADAGHKSSMALEFSR
ncbi:MAG: dihydroorotase [Bacteroidales bacterium]|nr:dihydroorotase [Candidatus Colimorpha onthohippi]